LESSFFTTRFGRPELTQRTAASPLQRRLALAAVVTLARRLARPARSSTFRWARRDGLHGREGQFRRTPTAPVRSPDPSAEPPLPWRCVSGRTPHIEPTSTTSRSRPLATSRLPLRPAVGKLRLPDALLRTGRLDALDSVARQSPGMIGFAFNNRLLLGGFAGEPDSEPGRLNAVRGPGAGKT